MVNINFNMPNKIMSDIRVLKKVSKDEASIKFLKRNLNNEDENIISMSSLNSTKSNISRYILLKKI